MKEKPKCIKIAYTKKHDVDASRPYNTVLSFFAFINFVKDSSLTSQIFD